MLFRVSSETTDVENLASPTEVEGADECNCILCQLQRGLVSGKGFIITQ